MLFDTEEESETSDCEKEHYKYYGDMTVVNITLQSKIKLDKLEQHAMLKYLYGKLNPDQCYINEYGEIYLILYKSYINVNTINDIQNIRASYFFDNDRNFEKNVVKTVSILGFSDKKMFMGYMSKCVILSCQRFLDKYYEEIDTFDFDSDSELDSDNEVDYNRKPHTSPHSPSTHSPSTPSTSTPSTSHTESSESERSVSLENYYIFPHTIKNLVKFSKETRMNINNYSDMWGTWIKYTESGEPITFSGFPINEDTIDRVYNFVMSSYTRRRKSTYVNFDHKHWYETYGRIHKQSQCTITDPDCLSSTESDSSSESSTENEVETYVKL